MSLYLTSNIGCSSYRCNYKFHVCVLIKSTIEKFIQTIKNTIMKNLKFWFSTLCIITLFSVTSYANNPEPVSAGEPITVTEQLHNLLETIDFSSLDEEKEMLVDFMINSAGEIIVLGTNDKRFDSAIKDKLNYEKLDNHNLTINLRYTLPITLKIL